MLCNGEQRRPAFPSLTRVRDARRYCAVLFGIFQALCLEALCLCEPCKSILKTPQTEASNY
jgi:hypothetical protein